jgi:hypothetical protein
MFQSKTAILNENVLILDFLYIFYIDILTPQARN